MPNRKQRRKENAMDARTRIDPATGRAERGSRSQNKEEQKKRWRDRRQREKEFGKPPSPIEQAHTTLEELKSALSYARQTP
jgi:hypothetical protein